MSTQIPRRPYQPHLLALEPRMMFDAAAAVAVQNLGEAATGEHAAAADARDATHDAVRNDGAERHGDAGPVTLDGDARTVDRADARAFDAGRTAAPAREIIFIDTAVDDYRQLAAEWAGRGEVVLIDGTKDGIDQVRTALAGRNDVSAIHLVSHGEAGAFWLGTTKLDTASITGTLAASLGAIGRSLGEGGDILIYGCDFAEGAEGARALTAFAQATHADVAASTDVTGFAPRGGDWVLEANRGSIETRALSSADWVHTLDPNTPVPISVTTDSLTVTDGSGTVIVSGTTGYGNDGRSPDVGMGAVAVWAGAATYQGRSIDLRATVVSLTSGDAVRFNRPAGGNANNGDDATFLLRDLTSGNTPATVQLRWELVDHATGDLLPADVRFTIADIDGIGGNPNTRETVTASTQNLAYYTRDRDSDIHFNATLDSIEASGTQDENDPVGPTLSPKSAASFDWTKVSAFTLTYTLTPNGVTNQAQFYHDGDADFVYDNPVYTSIPRLDLDGDDSTATGNDAHFTFTENGPGVPVVDSDVVVANPMDVDSITGATVTLTNYKAGDGFTVGTLPANLSYAIGAVSNGTLRLTFSGQGSEADYRQALQAVRFTNGSDTPDPTQRVIAVAIANDTLTSATATSRIDVIPVNDPPVAVGTLPTRQTQDAASVSWSTAAGFADPDGDSLVYSATGLPAGLGIDAATGVISGTVDRSASQPGGGRYVVTVTARDPSNATATQDFAITVANPAPVAADDSVTTAEDTPVRIDVLANDRDPDGDPLAVTGASALHGRVAINPDGTLTYTPDADYNGSDTISYAISDGQGGTATAHVAVTITPVNDAPRVTATPSTYAAQDGAVVNVSIASAFTDVDGDRLTYAASGLPRGLTLDPATGIVSGTIDRSASQQGGGVYRVVLTATDPSNAAASRTITLTVTNPAPIARDDAATTAEDTPATIAVLDNDSDPDGDPLTVVSASAGHGSVAINADGTLRYTPDRDFNGTDTITYTIDDGEGGRATARVTMTVTPVDDAPTAATLPARTTVDSATVSTPLAGFFTDVDGDALTYAATGLPAGLSIDAATGVISGTIADGSANGGAAGDGVFHVVVTATDPSGLRVDAPFDWTIAQSPPMPVDDRATTAEDVTVRIPVLANDRDPDGDPLTIVDATADHGVVTIDGDVLVFTPDANFNGDATIVYTVADPGGRRGTATVGVTVTPVADAPVAMPIAVDGARDGQAISLPVGGFFADPDGDPLRFAATGLPAGLRIDPATGTIAGTIDRSASQAGGGIYHVVVTATDPSGLAVDSAFDWTIVNPAPVAADDAATVREDTPAIIAVLANDRDPDGDPLTVVAASAGHGRVAINPDGTLSYTPDADFNGSDVIVYTIADGDGGRASASVLVTVTPVEDAPRPVGTPAVATLADGATVALDAGAWFVDPDGDRLTYAATGLPAGLSIDPATGRIAGTIDRSASQVAGGVYAVVVTATDPAGESGVQRVTLRVADPAPVAADDVARTDQRVGITIPVLANDRDPDGDPLTVVAAVADHGIVTINPDGSVRYVPADSFAGTDAIRYTISDGEGGTATAVVTIVVDPVNRAPVAAGRGPVDAVGGRPSIIDALTGVTDPDGDPLTITGATAANGVVRVNRDGTLAFTPALGFVGTTTITYTVADGKGGTVTATLVVRVADGRGADIEELLRIGRVSFRDPAPAAARIVLADGLARNPLALIGAVEDIRTLRSTAIGATPVLDAVEAIRSLRTTTIHPDAPIAAEVARLDAIRDQRDAGDRLFDQRWGDFLVKGLTGFSAAADHQACIMVESVVRGSALYIEVRDTAADGSRAPIRSVDLRMADGHALPDWIRVDHRGLAIVERAADLDELHLIVRVTRTDGRTSATPIVVQGATGEIELDRHARHAAHRSTTPQPLDATLHTPATAVATEAARLSGHFS